MIEDNGENGLRAAGVLDCLRCEEKAVFWGGGVVGSILGGCGVRRPGLVAGPFEEEDDSIDGAVCFAGGGGLLDRLKRR